MCNYKFQVHYIQRFTVALVRIDDRRIKRQIRLSADLVIRASKSLECALRGRTPNFALPGGQQFDVYLYDAVELLLQGCGICQVQAQVYPYQYCHLKQNAFKNGTGFKFALYAPIIADPAYLTSLLAMPSISCLYWASTLSALASAADNPPATTPSVSRASRSAARRH